MDPGALTTSSGLSTPSLSPALLGWLQSQACGKAISRSRLMCCQPRKGALLCDIPTQSPRNVSYWSFLSYMPILSQLQGSEARDALTGQSHTAQGIGSEVNSPTSESERGVVPRRKPGICFQMGNVSWAGRNNLVSSDISLAPTVPHSFS